jgi:hypothetical protein
MMKLYKLERYSFKFIFLILLIKVGVVEAYVPSSRMILDKVVENALKTPLYVEQEVNISSAQGSVSLKEQWLYENENAIRLIVKGGKDLQAHIQFQVHFSESQRTSSITGSALTSRLNHPLFEKIFFIKNTESLMRLLVQHEIVTNEIFNSQIFKKIPGNNGFQYQPEPFVRLSRLGGKVAYIFGPAPIEDKLTPGFWVEQDLFQILKIRNSQGEEFRLDKMVTFNRGARWAKELQLTWGTPTVTAQIQTVAVRTADANLKQLFQKRIEKRTLEFEKHPGKNLVEEFYSRFR